jgi:hypothetical protein
LAYARHGGERWEQQACRDEDVCLNGEKAQEAYDCIARASRTWVFGHQPKLKNETTQSHGGSKKPKGAKHDQISFVRYFLVSLGTFCLKGPSPSAQQQRTQAAETESGSVQANPARAEPP